MTEHGRDPLGGRSGDRTGEDLQNVVHQGSRDEPGRGPAAPTPPTGFARVLGPRPQRSLGVALVLVLAGFLFTTSAQTANGTQLRSERADLVELVRAEQARRGERERQWKIAEAEHRKATDAVTAENAELKRLEQQQEPLAAAAGLQPVRGPGLAVTLDDAPRDLPVGDGVRPDDLVVHQQDVQAVVNALWAGGAEAMMLQDQRVISTSAVRCVGNTLILQGRVYSPPYVVRAIGDPARLRAALDGSPEIGLYKQYVDSLHLGWKVEERLSLSMPGFEGSVRLRHARSGTPDGSPAATTADTSPEATSGRTGTTGPARTDGADADGDDG